MSITKVASGGKVVGYVGVARDISDRKLREEELVRLAERDDLTGLFNRRHLDASLPAEIERASREGRTLAVLVFDIDRFEEINDRFGNLCGDQALRCVARAIQERIRRGDTAYRLGGVNQAEQVRAGFGEILSALQTSFERFAGIAVATQSMSSHRRTSTRCRTRWPSWRKGSRRSPTSSPGRRGRIPRRESSAARNCCGLPRRRRRRPASPNAAAQGLHHARLAFTRANG